MWTRKELKAAARPALRRNYWRAVIVCLIMMVVAGTYGYSVLLDLSPTAASRVNTVRLVDIVEPVLRYVSGDGDAFATRGVLSQLWASATSSSGLLMSVLNSVAGFVFRGSVSAGVLMLVGVVFTILYMVFVSSILSVGEARFFQENYAYPQSGPARILFIYKIRRTRHTAAVLVWYYLAVFLWSFTIVGGVIVAYQLRMVPQILAENPNISRREAFRLSRGMMRGNKWRTFLLDMSFIGWYLISLFTLGLLSILWVNPYRSATEAQLYFTLRAAWLELHPDDKRLLHDELLFAPAAGATTYPVERFEIPESDKRRWLSLDYSHSYTFQHIVLMFFAFCLIGWVWEVSIELFGKGLFVNRGTLLGPWLPLYGCGGVLVVLLLGRLYKRPVVLYLAATLLCGTLEYFTSVILENLMGARWWDYTGYFLNLHGRVCLEALIVFGIAACLGVYLLAPMLDNLFSKWPHRFKTILGIVLLVVFAADVLYSFFNPNTGEHITFSLDPSENVYGTFT